jgi:inner membrane protein
MDNLDRNSMHGFEIVMKLAGSHELGFISSSQDTRIDLKANWGSPGFFGMYLPTGHVLDEQHFSASWDISELLSAPGYEYHQWVPTEWFDQGSHFGVRLVQPVETYQLVTRAAKYAVLFISLSFIVYFFAEVMTNMSLHPVQYLLVGGALCLFYLLLLSMAEHIPFSLAYFVSATASVMMISLYSISLLRSRAKALIMFVLLASLYTFLYVTLRSEAYALLMGSIGLFVILSLVMYLTRKIDWRRPGPVYTGGIE